MKKMEEIIQKAKELVTEDFINEVNKRKYEKAITDIATSIDLEIFKEDLKPNVKQDFDTVTKEEINGYINNYLKNNKPLAFNLFFIFYTLYRRSNYGDLSKFCYDYIDNFSEYEITRHIKILTAYASNKDANTYDTLIHKTDLLINEENSKFKEHAGVLNLYAALVCAYYEKNLDMRNGNEDQNIINKALEYTDIIIKQEKYSKYPFLGFNTIKFRK